MPHSEHVDTIAHFLKGTEVALVSKSGRSVGHIVKNSHKSSHEHILVYKIPCTGCTKPYYGETGRSLQVRLNEHRKDVQYQRPKTIVKHTHYCGALPNWNGAHSIKENINKQTRIAVEAAILEVRECMNPKTGRISLAETAAKLILSVHHL